MTLKRHCYSRSIVMKIKIEHDRSPDDSRHADVYTCEVARFTLLIHVGFNTHTHTHAHAHAHVSPS